MMKQKISEIISNIDEEYIREATDYVRIKSRPLVEWIKGKIWLAGLLVLIIFGGTLLPVLFDGNLFKKEPEKLVVCTDFSIVQYVRDAVDTYNYYQRQAGEPILEVEIMSIPKDETAADIKNTEIRTAIMAGEGPDLFIFQADNPRINSHEPVHMLFPQPEKAMYADIFYPLDEYLENSEPFNREKCNQIVLQAGQTKEGQMLLPLLYDYDVCLFNGEKESGSVEFPDSWEDIISSESMQQNLRSQTTVGFYSYFGQYADYEKEELLLTEEEILKYYKVNRSYEMAWPDFLTVQHTSMSRSFLDFCTKDENKKSFFYAVPDIDGEVTAHISIYGGINRHTEMSDVAFSFLECIYRDLKDGAPLMGSYGIPLEADEETLKIYRFRQMSEEQFNSIFENNARITRARFYNSWDQDIFEMCEKQWERDAPTLEEAVRQLYNKMLMQVKE